MELAIPSSLLSNLDIVIRYQNIQLIKEICAWKKWNTEELIEEFIDTTVKKKKKKKPLELKKSVVIINNETLDRNEVSKGVHEKNISLNNNNIEIRTRTPWTNKKQSYLLESPHNNVYKDGVYVGRFVDGILDKDYPEL